MIVTRMMTMTMIVIMVYHIDDDADDDIILFVGELYDLNENMRASGKGRRGWKSGRLKRRASEQTLKRFCHATELALEARYF